MVRSLMTKLQSEGVLINRSRCPSEAGAEAYRATLEGEIECEIISYFLPVPCGLFMKIEKIRYGEMIIISILQLRLTPLRPKDAPAADQKQLTSLSRRASKRP
jgi:hypothetical protein